LPDIYVDTGEERPSLAKKTSGIEKPHDIPQLGKIVIRMEREELVAARKIPCRIVEVLSASLDQKHVLSKMKKSLASFKLCNEMPLGKMATLRGDHLYKLLDRLITGMPRSSDVRFVILHDCDGHGNYMLGIPEAPIFTKIDFDQMDKTCGMNISIVTATRSDEQAYALLNALGLLFQQTGDSMPDSCNVDKRAVD
jgi:large subunit ribosomal protein L5